MSEPTKEAIEEALRLREKFSPRYILLYAPELAKIIAYVRTQAINDTLHTMRKCEKRSGKCFMVHSILTKRIQTCATLKTANQSAQ